jgi:hypothetical protein
MAHSLRYGTRYVTDYIKITEFMQTCRGLCILWVPVTVTQGVFVGLFMWRDTPTNVFRFLIGLTWVLKLIK